MFLCANVCYLKRMMHLELNDQTSSRQQGEAIHWMIQETGE
jgi:hypothetical protein